ncbi:TPA: hypothetical protein RQJ47_004389 [Vibrio vulnificus]|nr:hypothetical protein [Vibrio cholerae]MBE3749015.1 hypothetical protein [Vibrio parahaemolyticus]NGZ65250.1 hypothetical protein [Vibrio aestuarianus subsp. cardii]HAS6386956.1 hypothetical protein [Vibrio vulnificus]HAS6505919.1 hypothetical protein [Vibrio parahaemolyticus]
MISAYLPITVVVTLILFCTREVLDLTKRYREKKRMLATLKMLVSEELKDNYHALDVLYSVLTKVDKALKVGEKKIPVEKNVKTDRYGNDMANIFIGENGEYGVLHMPFPKFSTKRYESYIKDIASLDLQLYEAITEFYKELRYCEKIRCEVIEYLERDNNHIYWAFDHRVNLMFERKSEYESLCQNLHALLAGKHMKIERSEVVEIEI